MITNMFVPFADCINTDLSGIDLSNLDLEGTNFTGSSLAEANLTYTDLSRTSLYDVNLTGANLEGAILTGAKLGGTIFTDSTLRRADLTDIKQDLYKVLDSVPKEVKGLRQALLDGIIDGSTYKGKCACLIGTIANLCNVNYRELHIIYDSDRPIECFFLGIAKGDTPKDNIVSGIVVDWIDEWLVGQ